VGTAEEGTLAVLKATRRWLGDPTVKERRGRVVKTTGDGLLIEFAGVVDAGRHYEEDVRLSSAIELENPRYLTEIAGCTPLPTYCIDGNPFWGHACKRSCRDALFSSRPSLDQQC
jgi:class 3 adenylate cyclase